MKCEIKWIDKDGNATPDNNEAIQLARTKDRMADVGGANGPVHFTASRWYPICAEHSKRFSETGMHIWETCELTVRNEVSERL